MEAIMKKIRIISLLLVVLMLALALASCGGYQKLSNIYSGDYIDYSPAYAAAKELSAVAGATFIDLEGDIALFSKLDGTTITYTVLNVKTETVVGTYTSTENVVTTVKLEDAINTVFYKVSAVDSTNADKKTYSTKLYTMAGAEFAASTKEDVRYQAIADLVLLDEKVYRGEEDGSFSEAFDRPAYAGYLPDVVATDGEYYYAGGTSAVYTYDKELNLLAVIRTPSYAAAPLLPDVEGSFFLLGDGNVMMQYVVALPKDAEDFDIVNNGMKYDLHVVIVNAKNGNEKEIDSDYYFCYAESYVVYENGWSVADAEKRSKKIDVEAWGMKIVDQQISTDDDDGVELALSTSGKVEGTLEENIEGQDGSATRINADYFTIRTKDGKKKLVDMNGDVIADVSNVEYLLENMIVCEDVIYDYNLNEVYNLKDNEMTLFGKDYVYGGSVVLLQDKDGKIYLYTGPTDSGSAAAPQLIADNDKTKVYYYGSDLGFYVVDTTNATVTYTYYNNAGVAVLTVNEDLQYVSGGNDFSIYKAEDKFYVVK